MSALKGLIEDAVRRALETGGLTKPMVSGHRLEQLASPLVDPDDQIIDTKTLALMAGRSESYFQKLRWKGGGPPYIKFGNVCGYRYGDARAWLAAKTRRSTSDDHASAVRTPDNHTVA
jgi:hypothetical protein